MRRVVGWRCKSSHTGDKDMRHGLVAVCLVRRQSSEATVTQNRVSCRRICDLGDKITDRWQNTMRLGAPLSGDSHCSEDQAARESVMCN